MGVTTADEERSDRRKDYSRYRRKFALAGAG
jgi:hypothetical protein